MNDASPLARISNADLRWDGTAFGLQPRIVDEATARLVDDRAVSDAAIRALLRDPDRFAVAHVLLTLRSKTVGSFDASQWNGLRVALEASGAVRYEPSDMDALARRWDAAP